jgi:hypothetical protein
MDTDLYHYFFLLNRQSLFIGYLLEPIDRPEFNLIQDFKATQFEAATHARLLTTLHHSLLLCLAQDH